MNISGTGRWGSAVICAIFLSTLVFSQQNGKAPIDPAGIQRLKADSGDTVKITVSKVTGAVQFARLPGKKGDLAPATSRGLTSDKKSAAFWRQYGSVFGIKNADTELQPVGKHAEKDGSAHYTYMQMYGGVPVF